MPDSGQGAVLGAKEPAMFKPLPEPSRSARTRGAGRTLTVAELAVVIKELDRVVAALEESLTEIALPLDEPSRRAARDAIDAARWH